jgi:hypothetical protein
LRSANSLPAITPPAYTYVTKGNTIQTELIKLAVGVRLDFAARTGVRALPKSPTQAGKEPR